MTRYGTTAICSNCHQIIEMIAEQWLHLDGKAGCFIPAKATPLEGTREDHYKGMAARRIEAAKKGSHEQEA
jgi:hypothetical protein